MKRIQQYCSVTDRLKQDPACKEEVLKLALQPKIHMTKRGMITGSAVAAALLALNIGIGGYLLAGNRAGDELLSAANEEVSVAEADVLPETTVTGTSLSAAAETVRLTASTAKATSAAAQSSTQKTTKTAAASQSTEKPAAGQTASAGTDTTVRTTAHTTAKTTAEPDAAFVPAEQNGEVIYRIIPTDRNYTDGTENEELNSCHAEYGETLTVKMTVENMPAAAAGNLRISCQGAEVLGVQKGAAYPDAAETLDISDSAFGGFTTQIDYHYRNSLPVQAADGTAVFYVTLKMPEFDNNIWIIPDNNYNLEMFFADADMNYPFRYGCYGLKICVGEGGKTFPPMPPFKEENDVSPDADDEAAFAEPFSPVHLYPAYYEDKPESIESADSTDRDFWFEVGNVQAHAGDKNVAVPVIVHGNTGFSSGGFLFPCDPALSLSPDPEFDPDKDSANKNVRAESTKLMKACLMSVTTPVSDPNFAFIGFASAKNTVSDGTAFILYYDVPEDAAAGSTYQIRMKVYNLEKHSDEAEDLQKPYYERIESQSIQNQAGYVSGGITIVP